MENDAKKTNKWGDEKKKIAEKEKKKIRRKEKDNTKKKKKVIRRGKGKCGKAKKEN